MPKKSIHKKLVGTWEVHGKENGRLIVRQTSPNLSLWYQIIDDPEEMALKNHDWYGSSRDRFTEDEIKSISWPSYVEPETSETIHILPSGNYYTEQND